MAFWKKYPKSKDARKRMKRFHDSRDFDPACIKRECPACKSNRTHSTRKRLTATEERMRE
jgi:hypothetical protein